MLTDGVVSPSAAQSLPASAGAELGPMTESPPACHRELLQGFMNSGFGRELTLVNFVSDLARQAARQEVHHRVAVPLPNRFFAFRFGGTAPSVRLDFDESHRLAIGDVLHETMDDTPQIGIL